MQAVARGETQSAINMRGRKQHQLKIKMNLKLSVLLFLVYNFGVRWSFARAGEK